MENIMASREEIAQELGKVIKDTRVSKEIGIEQLADKFKVSKSALETIEKGEILTNQNSYFTRLLVKKYLNELAIATPENKFLVDEIYPNENDDAAKTISIDPLDIKFGDDLKKKQAKKNLFALIKYSVITVFLGLLILVLFYFLSVNLKNTANNVVNETTLVENTTLVPKEVINPKVVTEVKVKEDGKGNTFVITSLGNPNSYKLKITFTGDCYVYVYDYKTQEDIVPGKVYKAGETLEVEIKNKQSVQINLGATQNATIFVDDMDIKLADQKLTGQKYINILNEIK